MDTGTYTSNVQTSVVPTTSLGGGYGGAPQVIGNPTPTVKTLPPRVVKTTLPPQYKTRTLPPRVVRVNLPPVGPVGGQMGQPTVTATVTAHDVNGDGVPDRKVQVITGGPGLASVPGGINVDLNRDGLNDFGMTGAGGASTFVQPQAGAQYL